LSTEKKPWKYAFDRVKVEYGHCTESHQLRPHHEGLRRRQNPTSATSVPAGTAASLIIPTASPTATSVTFDLSHSESDSTFPLEDEDSITIGCKLCKTTGSLELSQGDFEVIGLKDISITHPPSVLDLITSGSISLEMNGFTAYVELQVSPYLSGDVTHTLFSVPVLGFSVRKLESIFGA
jgi:hypothetical protein